MNTGRKDNISVDENDNFDPILLLKNTLGDEKKIIDLINNEGEPYSDEEIKQIWDKLHDSDIVVAFSNKELKKDINFLTSLINDVDAHYSLMEWIEEDIKNDVIDKKLQFRLWTAFNDKDLSEELTFTTKTIKNEEDRENFTKEYSCIFFNNSESDSEEISVDKDILDLNDNVNSRKFFDKNYNLEKNVNNKRLRSITSFSDSLKTTEVKRQK